LNRKDHGKKHRKHKVDIEVECYLCKRIFILTTQKQRQRDKNKYRNDKGPFCSKECVGRYTAEKQKFRKYGHVAQQVDRQET
jgi:hypothetical protein